MPMAASANNENAFAGIMVGLDEPVKDMREFLALDAELAGRAGAAKGEHHRARPVLLARGANIEQAVGSLVDHIHAFSGVNVEISSVHDCLPKSQQLLFG